LINSADLVDEDARGVAAFFAQSLEHVAVHGNLAGLCVGLDREFALKCLDVLFCCGVDCPGATQHGFELHAQRGCGRVGVAASHQDEQRVPMLHREANGRRRDVRAVQIDDLKVFVVQSKRLRHRFMQLARALELPVNLFVGLTGSDSTGHAR
jgi:hypothetical protein